MESFMQNLKKWLGSKMLHFVIFSQGYEENYCHTWNQHSQICQSENDSCKNRKFGSLREKCLLFG